MRFITLLSAFFVIANTNLTLIADEISLEDEIKEAFKNYPF